MDHFRGLWPGSRLPIFVLALSACANGPTPHRLTDASVTPGVWGVEEFPTAPGPHPAVILVPGSGGWRPGYTAFARALADSGFVALTLDYYAVTGRGSTRAEEMRNWPMWQATIRNAITYVRSTAAVQGAPVAVIGFSRGAMLAISIGAHPPPIAALVDFYGAGSDDDPPDSLIPRFPPLLILHGEADRNIPVAQAQRLHERVRAHGGEVEMHLYPGAAHGFNTPWGAGYEPAIAADSWSRTIAFLKRHVSQSAASLQGQ